MALRTKLLNAARVVAFLPLTVTLAACGGMEPAAPPEPDGPLEVGFGKASLVWRVGAKPGQVGTHALPIQQDFFVQGLIELLPILQQDPPELLPDATAWAKENIEEQIAQTKPGVYNRLFEPSVGIELPPTVRAVVVRRGKKKVALVRADLYVMHEQLHRSVASLIEEETGIGRDQLFLVGTHNHSVAHSMSPAPGVWTRADAFDPRHLVYVTHQIASAIVQANENLEPGELRVARHSLSSVQHNIIGPSTAHLAPPGEANLVDVDAGYPYDHFDPDLLMLRFDKPAGGPIGSIFIWGMHPESLPEGHGLLSAEWPTHVEDRVIAATGAEAMWLPGPLGDVEADKGFLDPTHTFFRGGFDSMRRMSDIIAEAVTTAWELAGEKPGESEPLFAQVARDVPGPADYPLPDLQEAGPRLPMVRVVQDGTAMRIHLVRLGDALLMGVPAEVTTDLALNMKSRVDQTAGNVYQGYVYPTAPDWVHDRIMKNFSTSEVDPGMGAPFPMIVSVTNGYFGYIVSRWEYENRAHYRMSMTAFGPGTADHVSSAAVALARELSGGQEARFTYPDFRTIDQKGIEEIQTLLAGLTEPVTEMARVFPASDPAQVGTVIESPLALPPAGEPLQFSWIGGTNDMVPPVIYVDEATADGFREVDRGPNGDIYLLFQAPDVWTASWNAPEASGASLRFRVEGVFRGPNKGVSTPDPIWDPDGANQAYSVVSDQFVVTPAP